MHEDVKREWVAALRSGEYKQGQGALKSGDKYCCLGVLCDLAVKHGAPVVVDEGPAPLRPGESSATFFDRRSSALPLRVQDWAGVSTGLGALPVGVEVDGFTLLSELNDHAGYTFDQIADVIEEYL